MFRIFPNDIHDTTMVFWANFVQTVQLLYTYFCNGHYFLLSLHQDGMKTKGKLTPNQQTYFLGLVF